MAQRPCEDLIKHVIPKLKIMPNMDQEFNQCLLLSMMSDMRAKEKFDSFLCWDLPGKRSRIIIGQH